MSEDEIVEGAKAPETQPPVAGETVSLSKAEYEKMQSDIEHLKTQDRNFSALRNKQLGTLTPEEKEKVFGEEMELIKKTQAEFVQSQRQERIDDALDVFGGSNAEAREKFAFYFKNDRRSDTAMSAKEILSLMKEYQPLVRGTSLTNPLDRAMGHFAPSSHASGEPTFTDSEKGKQFRKELRLPTSLDSAKNNSSFRIKGENE